MPINALNHAIYFTVRSGGRTVITFLMDCCFTWTISIPVAYLLSRYTSLPIIELYLICNLLDLIKSVIGLILVKNGLWVRRII